MNRIGLGLAIGAGYLLGRTRKLKMAVAVGSMVAGKRLNLSPKALLDLANQQLRDNPQFKEIGDQLRHDLRGVGKAASGAMVERQVDALADRLHGRTAEVRDQLAGAVPATSGLGLDGGRDDKDADADDEGARDERHPAEAPQEKAPVAKKVPAKKAAKKAPAKKAAHGRPAAKKTAGRAAGPKGGGDR
ncbi:DNA primase [Streptomyces sp. NPDC004237]|uniref:DNA primase n=1 Tax=Streptomyces sp. NPDC004237 TaxID=3154455 RepID=UPI0033B707C8